MTTPARPNKTVVDGVLRHVSPSQVTTFELCARRWWGEKVKGLREEQTAAQSGGELLHKEMENWYELGTQPTNASALRILDDPRIPPRSEHVRIEHPRDYKLGLVAAGVPVIGRIDLFDLTPGPLDRPRLVDWKSTSGLKWTKTAEELARNVQLIVYGKFLFTFHVRNESLSMAHGYLLTRGVGAKLVVTDPLPQSHFDDCYSALEATVAEMKTVAALSELEAVPPTFSRNTCKAFNKLCPVAGYCGEEAFRAAGMPWPKSATQTEGNEVSLAEMMKSRMAQLDVPVAPVVRAEGINPPDAARPDMPERPAPSTTTSTPVPQPGTTSSTSPGVLILYVDCVPVKGEDATGYVRLEEEIARRADPIAKGHKVSDVREVKFGEGTSALIAAFRREPMTGVVVATDRGLSSAVLEVLSAQAQRVVRALR